MTKAVQNDGGRGGDVGGPMPPCRSTRRYRKSSGLAVGRIVAAGWVTEWGAWRGKNTL